MSNENDLILDTVIVESLWTGGDGRRWLSKIISGEATAAISASSLAELVRRAPTRRAEIQLAALMAKVNTLALDAAIARRAGQIARDLDSDDLSAMVNASVAATSIETGLPIACVDEEFFTAMGCEIAELD